MHSSTIISSLFLALFTASTTSLRAVPAQQCAGVCGDVTETTGNDIVCSNADMDNTQRGQAMKKCFDCQLNSTAADPNTGETDTRWLLYNVRFAMSSCLWSFPNTSYSLQANPCLTNPACGLYEGNIQYDNLSSSVSAYDYCDGFNGRATTQQPKCQSCLGQLSDDSYLSNFFTILIAGCMQKPNPGTPLSISGTTLFSTTALNITTPQSTNTASSSPNHVSGPLNLGAIVGVVITAIVLLLAILGCSIIWCGKKRRRAKLAERAERHAAYVGFGAKAPLGGHTEPKWSNNLTPGGASPNDISPASAGGYSIAGTDKAFSPYVSQYSSPVSARDMLNLKQAWDWQTPASIAAQREKGGVGLGLGEAIEMEKIRDLRLAERRMRDERVHQDFLRDAAERGFTTSPITGRSQA